MPRRLDWDIASLLRAVAHTGCPHIDVRHTDGVFVAPAVPADAHFGRVRVKSLGGGHLVWSERSAARVAEGVIEVLGQVESDPLLAEITALLALARQRRFHLHAAVVEHEGEAVVIAGGSGVGKTTTALGLGARGATIHGDDIALLWSQSQDLRLAALPLPIAASEVTARLFSESLVPASGAGPTFAGAPGKRSYLVRAGIPVVESRAPLSPKMIVFPELDSTAPTRASRVDPVPAYLRLLASAALSLIPGIATRAELTQILAAMAERVPAYSLRLGPDALAQRTLSADLIFDVIQR